MITKLFKGTRLWLGNNSGLLVADTDFDLENVTTIDGVAEVLAGNVANYGVNIAALSHLEDGPLVDGKPTKIHVSYGVGGARIEAAPEEVVDLAAIQAKNVAEADAAKAQTETETEARAAQEEADRLAREETARQVALETQAKEHARLGADVVLAQTGAPPVVLHESATEEKEA